MKKIRSIEELKELATTDFIYCYIALAAGIARSSKRILYTKETDTFDVINEIDDSEQENLSVEQLRSETNIVDAIESGNLYQY